MLIRKEFKVESAHVVRNCTSFRCSHSIHGHSAIVEVVLRSNTLDNAQMVYDFGLMNRTIKQFIDGMDHCYLLCKYDKEDFKEFIKANCDRWIELPFNPSAEMLSLFIYAGVEHILQHTLKSNGEGLVSVEWVRYHETRTGWAQCDGGDYERFKSIYSLKDVNFSDGVIADFDADLEKVLFNNEYITNPEPTQQINIPLNIIQK